MKLIRTANCVTKSRSQHVKPSITSEKIITEFEFEPINNFPQNGEPRRGKVEWYLRQINILLSLDLHFKVERQVKIDAQDGVIALDMRH